MLTEIKRMPCKRQELYELDSRYQQPRRNLSLNNAQEMARVDALIESAGVRFGDTIEVLFESDDGSKQAWFKPCIGVKFHDVHDGLFRVSNWSGGVEGYKAKQVLGVRKYTPSESPSRREVQWSIFDNFHPAH
jgi:hypothetical protein